MPGELPIERRLLAFATLDGAYQARGGGRMVRTRPEDRPASGSVARTRCPQVGDPDVAVPDGEHPSSSALQADGPAHPAQGQPIRTHVIEERLTEAQGQPFSPRLVQRGITMSPFAPLWPGTADVGVKLVLKVVEEGRPPGMCTPMVPDDRRVLVPPPEAERATQVDVPHRARAGQAFPPGLLLDLDSHSVPGQDEAKVITASAVHVRRHYDGRGHVGPPKDEGTEVVRDLEQGV